jgi:polysaccharide export outer membrane protein
MILTAIATPLEAEQYRLGYGDVVKVTVYGHADLETLERVSGDGVILFPLLGQVYVAGLTVPEVSARISALLADGFIVSPQVSVFVVEFRSQKAVIMGEVGKPGLYELKGRTTFLELVSLAGGLTRDAGDMAVIRRRGVPEGSPDTVITIDLYRIIEEGDTSTDALILDGDSIYITKAGLFYVTGEVKRPDAYRFTEGTTVIMAITMAGGFTDKSASGKIRIIRRIQGLESIIEGVPMDEPIAPDDVIVVPESFF